MRLSQCFTITLRVSVGCPQQFAFLSLIAAAEAGTAFDCHKGIHRLSYRYVFRTMCHNCDSGKDLCCLSDAHPRLAVL